MRRRGLPGLPFGPHRCRVPPSPHRPRRRDILERPARVEGGIAGGERLDVVKSAVCGVFERASYPRPVQGDTRASFYTRVLAGGGFDLRLLRNAVEGHVNLVRAAAGTAPTLPLG